jgi:small Trp-rich protein
MWLIGIGLLLFVLHALEIGPPGRWNLEPFGDLWKFLVPFGLAAVWWAISDSTGLTQRRAMRKMEERKQNRRQRDMENLGLDPRRPQASVKRHQESGSRDANLRDGKPSKTPREPRL